MGRVLQKDFMNNEQTNKVLDLIEKTLDVYERMLQKIVIEKDKDFNTVPFEKSINALNQLLEERNKND